MRKTQNGFSLPHILLVLVLVVIIGFAGWRVYESQKATNQSLDNAANANDVVKPEEKKKEFALPDDYVFYEDKTAGYKFAYPKVYGEFKPVPETQVVTRDSNRSHEASTEPVTPYVPGAIDPFHVYGWPKEADIVSRKYGPRIRLTNGKWIVTEASESDVVNNKAGDEYKDFNNKIPQQQDNNGLAVYTLEGGDEGIHTYNLFFVAGDSLIEVDMPNFSDGMYGGGPANDQTAYNHMLKNVRDSIALIK